MTESAAKAELERVGLKPGNVTTTATSDQTKDGTVANLNKTGSVPKGTAVDYTIYKFTASSPSVNP